MIPRDSPSCYDSAMRNLVVLFIHLKHTDLVAQRQVLELESNPRTEDRKQSCEECRERNEHRPEL